MPPVLQNLIPNGASRHRLRKGFLLMRNDGGVLDTQLRSNIVRVAKNSMAQKATLAEFALNTPVTEPSLVEIVTPFHPIYTCKQRNVFMQSIATATSCLTQAADDSHCQLIAAGVNPYPCALNGKQAPALCADIHQIEIFDEGEIERIYNLFRQFLPELLAISANSPIFEGEIKNHASYRMRENPQSFLPYYLSQFAANQLERLERMMRKDHALTDLRLMDINPLDGSDLLTERSLLKKQTASVELRFVDAQCSYSFVRAQIILFQAIAMHGRSLARQGRRLRRMRDSVIDANKALAYKDGASAVFQPDAEWRQEEKGKGYTFHDKGEPERATTALLMDIEGCLIAALRDLECQPWELFPILLGAELRRHGKSCIANYEELQQYL